MNHKGFSLIELIVVIAIMGVAVGIGGFSLSYLQSARSKQCAENLNAAMEVTRVAGMSRAGTVELEVYKKEDGIYVFKSWMNSEEKIGGSRITVSYQYGDMAAPVEIGGVDNKLVISFDKESGGIKKPTTANKLVLSIHGNKDYTITCYKLTGKTVLE